MKTFIQNMVAGFCFCAVSTILPISLYYSLERAIEAQSKIDILILSFGFLYASLVSIGIFWMVGALCKFWLNNGQDAG